MATNHYGNAPLCVICGDACDCGEHHSTHRGENACGACSLCWETHDEECDEPHCQLCEMNKSEVA